LKTAQENNLLGLTAHLFGTQTFVYSYQRNQRAEQKDLRNFERFANALCKKSEHATTKLARTNPVFAASAPKANKITSWDALLFAIGDKGDECTSRYTDWLGK